MSPAETEPGFRTVLSCQLTPYELPAAAGEFLSLLSGCQGMSGDCHAGEGVAFRALIPVNLLSGSRGKTE